MPEPPASPIAVTFAVLARGEGARVSGCLVRALDVPDLSIQRAAIETILKRAVGHERHELLKRVEQFPQELVEFLHHAGPALEPTFRQFLAQGQPELREVALRAMRVTRQYGQLGRLIELLTRKSLVDHAVIAATLSVLVDRLHDELRETAGESTPRRTVLNTLRGTVLSQLDHAVEHWETLTHPREIVEAILILGDPYHPVVKRVLWHAPEACRSWATGLLLESRHPGVLRLIAESLTEAYPHPKVFEAIRTRRDPEFLAALLRVVSRRRALQQLHHLRQIEHVDWLSGGLEALTTIPPALQPALIAFVQATHVPREVKTRVQEWLLRYGTPDGKRAATEGLTLLDEAVIQEVVRDSLDSEDAELQAWATSQLRQHAIPEAFGLLIARLDSPLPAVQAAARAELADFNVDRVLALAEEFPLEDARRAGQLLMKVDPEAVVKLRRALSHAVVQKRVTAARRIGRLGLAEPLLSSYATLAVDPDPLVRRTVADVVSTLEGLEAFRLLSQLIDDPHPRVREAAAQGLERWEQSMSLSQTAATTDPLLEGADW